MAVVKLAKFTVRRMPCVKEKFLYDEFDLVQVYGPIASHFIYSADRRWWRGAAAQC